MRRCRALVVAATAPALACGQQTAFSEWRQDLAALPVCDEVSTVVGRGWVSWHVEPSGALLVLPPQMSEARGVEGYHAWLGADSSEFTYAEGSEPSGGMAGHGGILGRLRRPSYRFQALCRLSVQGKDGTSGTFIHVDSAGRDTVFGLALTVALTPRSFSEVSVLAPTAAMRDSLRGAALHMLRP